MYNEDRKRRFIESYSQLENTRYQVARTLERLSVYEENMGVDFTEMTQEQAMFVLSELGGAGEGNISKSRHILVSYSKWCQENQIHVQNNLRRAKPALSTNVKQEFVKSPQHMKRTLNRIFWNESDSTVDVLCKAWLWFAYMGLDDREAVRVESSFLDFKSMKLTMDDSFWRVYTIYPESVRDLKVASEITRFYETMKNGRVRYFDRLEGNLVLRGKALQGHASENTMVQRYRDMLVKRIKSLKEEADGDDDLPVPRISYNTIYDSGVFYRVYQMEGLGITPNFMKHADKNYAGMDIEEEALHIYRRRAALGMEKKYTRWKQMFSL